MRRGSYIALAALATFAVSSASAQTAISAKAGLIHYVIGDATLDGKPVQIRTGNRLVEMKNGNVLSTTEGRAEVMLAPGVVFRMDADSSMRLDEVKMEDVRLELTQGNAIVEVMELAKEHNLSLTVGKAQLQLRKPGIFQLSPERGIRVYEGEVQLMADGKPQTLKKGSQLDLTSGLVAKFDRKDNDALYRWAFRRSEEMALVNVSSARMLGRSFSRTGMGLGAWVFNPYFNSYTYLPMNSRFISPFGFAFWDPYSVGNFYNRYIPAPTQTAGGGFDGSNTPRYNPNLGYNTVDSRGSMASSGGAGAAAAPAPAAGGARASDGGGTSRGDSAGGRVR